MGVAGSSAEAQARQTGPPRRRHTTQLEPSSTSPTVRAGCDAPDRELCDDGPVDDLRKRNIIIGVAIVILGAAVALVVAVLGGDDGDDDASTTTTTSAPATTTSTTLPEVTTTTVPAADLDLAAFPDLASGSRFAEPRALVKAFATSILLFDTDVVVGELAQGDNRSGEIEIHPPRSTLVTTVLVRQISDGSWVVVAATTESIRLDTPAAATRVSSPQPLLGAASAYEGHVDVMLYADGGDVPLATTFVTGRGDGQLGDFTGSLRFTAPEGATRGVLVLTSANGDDGTTIAATAIRVRF